MNLKYFLLIVVIYFITSCGKKDFLNQKPQASLETPTKLSDLQSLLDNDGSMNGLDAQGVTPQLGESGSDNYFLLDDDFNSRFRPQMQNYYIWAKDPYQDVVVLDWLYPYRNILMCNVVLDEINKIKVNNHEQHIADKIKGEAHFHRAHLFFQLAAVFSPIYFKGLNAEDRSIPLRLTSDINEVLKFSSVSETFKQIEVDLLTAESLLPETSTLNTKPSKAAVFALLSRMYLYNGDYNKALKYADLCLAIHDQLLDYNDLDKAAAYPFNLINTSNTEIIFNSVMLSNLSQSYPTRQTYARIDSLLYFTYEIGDLRKEVYFLASPPGYRFRGSYNGSARYFSGLAIDEVLYNKAECLAREGNINGSLKVLNTLRKSRWDNQTLYFNLQADSQEQLLNLVLNERRKGLVFRGLRWMDLKRLNQEGLNIVLKRVINGKTYTLKPNDERWVWPIPNEVLAFMD